MKEIIVYLFTFALISLLLNFFPQNNKSLPIPHLSTSTSIIILDGSTSYHPSLPLYQRIYTANQRVSIQAQNISFIRLIKREQDMTGIINTYSSLEFLKGVVDMRFLDGANLFRFMDKMLIVPIQPEDCFGVVERRATGDTFCKMEINSISIVKIVVGIQQKMIQDILTEQSEQLYVNQQEHVEIDNYIIEQQQQIVPEEKQVGSQIKIQEHQNFINDQQIPAQVKQQITDVVMKEQSKQVQIVNTQNIVSPKNQIPQHQIQITQEPLRPIEHQKQDNSSDQSITIQTTQAITIEVNKQQQIQQDASEEQDPIEQLQEPEQQIEEQNQEEAAQAEEQEQQQQINEEQIENQPQQLPIRQVYYIEQIPQEQIQQANTTNNKAQQEKSQNAQQQQSINDTDDNLPSEIAAEITTSTYKVETSNTQHNQSKQIVIPLVQTQQVAISEVQSIKAIEVTQTVVSIVPQEVSTTNEQKKIEQSSTILPSPKQQPIINAQAEEPLENATIQQQNIAPSNSSTIQQANKDIQPINDNQAAILNEQNKQIEQQDTPAKEINTTEKQQQSESNEQSIDNQEVGLVPVQEQSPVNVNIIQQTQPDNQTSSSEQIVNGAEIISQQVKVEPDLISYDIQNIDENITSNSTDSEIEKQADKQQIAQPQIKEQITQSQIKQQTERQQIAEQKAEPEANNQNSETVQHQEQQLTNKKQVQSIDTKAVKKDQQSQSPQQITTQTKLQQENEQQQKQKIDSSPQGQFSEQESRSLKDKVEQNEEQPSLKLIDDQMLNTLHSNFLLS